MPVFRSFLFAPGNHPRKVEKVFEAGADAVILDLEDAVAIAEKKSTRRVVVEALQRSRPCRGYVRVNSIDTEFCYGDLVEVAQPGVDGIVLPKVERADQLFAVDWLLTQLERERGLQDGAIDLIPIIETGAGLAAIDRIARSKSRVRRLAFGAGDFTLDMNMRWSRTEAELEPYRAQIVLASRVAGLEPPIDTVWADLRDQEGMRASSETALRIGFQGKLCIHPNQVSVVNEVFTPTEKEITFAERVIEAFKKAEAKGSASIQLDGQFIDYPIVYKARRVLATAERIRANSQRA